jgi:hypothetical protein
MSWVHKMMTRPGARRAILRDSLRLKMTAQLVLRVTGATDVGELTTTPECT